MKTKIAGSALIAIGIIMIAFTGFHFVTAVTAADLAPIKINQEKSSPIQWLPVIALALLLGGIVMIGPDKKTEK